MFVKDRSYFPENVKPSELLYLFKDETQGYVCAILMLLKYLTFSYILL